MFIHCTGQSINIKYLPIAGTQDLAFGVTVIGSQYISFKLVQYTYRKDLLDLQYNLKGIR